MALRLLRFTLAWLFTAIYWFVVITLQVLCFKRLPSEWIVAIAHFWGKGVLALLGIRLVIEGPSTIAERAPRVVITNHQSALDVVWGAVIFPPAALAIGKREVIYIPVLNLIWWALDFIRIDRSNHARAVAALAGVSEKIVREKRSLVIAPEGTRSPTGEMLPFKKGAFHIAREAGVPIHPMVVSGAYELLPKQSLIPKPGVIRLRFLPPVPTAGLTHEQEGALIERVRGQMLAAYSEMRTS